MSRWSPFPAPADEDDRSICLWTTTKKKPISTAQLAHGVNEYASASEGVIGTARWITALACVGYGDVFASGPCPPSPCARADRYTQARGTV